MNCDETTTRLHAYQDGELSPASRAAVELHLDDCVECQRKLERIQAVCQMLDGGRPAPDIPAGFAERVLERAAERADKPTSTPKQPGRPPRWTIGPTPERARRVAAAAMLLLGLGLGVLLGADVWWTPNSSPTADPALETPRAYYGLDVLSEAPEGSLVDTYITVTEP
ncbi:MAG: anti-sigma factor family protein [Persicimonas sp.]